MLYDAVWCCMMLYDEQVDLQCCRYRADIGPGDAGDGGGLGTSSWQIWACSGLEAD